MSKKKSKSVDKETTVPLVAPDQEQLQKDTARFQELLMEAIKETNITFKAQITSDGPTVIMVRVAPSSSSNAPKDTEIVTP